MTIIKYAVGILGACSMLTTVYAQDLDSFSPQSDAEPALEEKTTENQAEAEPFLEEGQKKLDDKKEVRDRSLSEYKTLRQGFYPKEQITQQPIRDLTEGSIKSPTTLPERKELPPFKGFK